MQSLYKIFKTFSLYNYSEPEKCEAVHIASLLRRDDKEEVSSMYDGDAVNGILDSVKRSSTCFLIYDNKHRIAGVIGISIVSGMGFPWFLSTIYFDSIAKEFSRWARQETQHNKIPFCNYVLCTYTKSIRWLQWLGFTVDTESQHFNGKFYRLHKEVS